MDGNGTKDDLIAWGDVAAAIGLLTRLPVRVDMRLAGMRGSRSAWAWPLAGVVVAVLAGAIGSVALWLGLTPMLAALTVVAAQVLITGALHEDGLADCADGLWGGWTVDRRLEIMKDSRIGAYGVIALVLSLAARWTALAALMTVGGWWLALVALAALSRVPMAFLQATLPSVRRGGLSDRVGRPPASTVWTAAAVGAGVALLALGPLTMPLILVTMIVTMLWAAIARAKIGGQTGDILGAGQQIAEIAGLLALVSLTA